MNMRGKKINSLAALLIFLLVTALFFAYIFGRADESVSDTLKYTPQTIKDLKTLNQQLSTTSIQGDSE